MQHTIKYLYNYFNYKPHVGILSAVTSYLIAVRGMLLTDETLKLIAAISSCAGCIVGCATALSWLFRASIWAMKFYQTLKLKFKK
ncbi:hypothetical protein HH214_04380 [Mucilaginibacter robiniae]|uniref:Uncharacterized protein n=1 Tax=Mucilaginibacter robiniae TaxID=2728022 RepID=A0A7L5DVQ0_9SPHI|nr:hypothetical protein [Mucilaginibacter robiniae]QJD95170.1 hypothetical protein HH214_04380 [Mucilaginibacter robiniae]